MWSGLSGPKSWLFWLALGLSGALVGYVIFTVWLGIGDSNVFDFGGVLGAIIGVIILLPFVGIVARLRGVKKPAHRDPRARARRSATRPARDVFVTSMRLPGPRDRLMG